MERATSWGQFRVFQFSKEKLQVSVTFPRGATKAFMSKVDAAVVVCVVTLVCHPIGNIRISNAKSHTKVPASSSSPVE